MSADNAHIPFPASDHLECLNNMYLAFSVLTSTALAFSALVLALRYCGTGMAFGFHGTAYLSICFPVILPILHQNNQVRLHIFSNLTNI